MNNLSSSIMYDPLCSENNEIFHNFSSFVPPIQLEGDKLIPPFEKQNDELHNILNQIPTFTKDPLLKTNPRKRSQASNLAAINHDQEIDMNPNPMKKRQKIIHREIERKRRLEMSSLHTSLKSLLPVECTKGKRSISDHLGAAEKYKKQMQKMIQVFNDKRDALIKEMSKSKGHEYDNDVFVNVFKGSLEVIVSISCGLPLSKVLQCILQEGFDVVSSISKKVNSNFVHSIHVQVGDENNIAIDATNLRKKLADIQRRTFGLWDFFFVQKGERGLYIMFNVCSINWFYSLRRKYMGSTSFNFFSSNCYAYLPRLNSRISRQNIENFKIH